MNDFTTGALYRQHRPESFAQFIGQAPIVQALLGALIRERMHHAYLFAGPRGSGKTSLARIYARALCCSKRGQLPAQDLPCNSCISCMNHLEGSHPDIVELDGASSSGIDQVRSMVIEPAQYQPLQSPYRVFIIDEAHRLSGAAISSLLKLMEEPPPYAIFILCTTDPQSIPHTLRDRCWQFKMHPGSHSELVELVLRAEPNTPRRVAELIAEHARGSFRRALASLDLSVVSIPADELDPAISAASQLKARHVLDALRLPPPALVRQLLEALHSKDAAQLHALIETVHERGVDNIELLRILEHQCYQGLLAQYQITEGGLRLPSKRLQIQAWKHVRALEPHAEKDKTLDLALWGLLEIASRQA